MKNIQSALAGLAIVFAFLLAALSGCTKDPKPPFGTIPTFPGVFDPLNPLTPADSILLAALKSQDCDTFDFIVNNIAAFDFPDATGIVALGQKQVTETGGWRCTSQDFKASEGFSENFAVSQIPFFPSRIWDGASIGTGGNRALIGDRKAARISKNSSTPHRRTKRWAQCRIWTKSLSATPTKNG